MTWTMSNHYRTTIWVALQHFDANCQGGADPFRTHGWFQYEPGESAAVDIPGFDNLLNIPNSHYYFYAEAADGAVWSGDFNTWCPQQAFNWCNNLSSTTARLLGFREVIVAGLRDFTLPPFVPGDLRPTVNVDTEKHQLGGWVTVIGDGFTPVSQPDIFADNLANRPLPLFIGRGFTDANGRFNSTFDERCWPNQDGLVTVRAQDSLGAGFATDTTTAYTC
jgi:hypothetical protein